MHFIRCDVFSWDGKVFRCITEISQGWNDYYEGSTKQKIGNFQKKRWKATVKKLSSSDENFD